MVHKSNLITEVFERDPHALSSVFDHIMGSIGWVADCPTALSIESVGKIGGFQPDPRYVAFDIVPNESFAASKTKDISFHCMKIRWVLNYIYI